MASAADIKEFLNGPLVCWLTSCVDDIDNKLHCYENYFDGFPFREVLLKIDPDPSEPVPPLASFNDSNIVNARIQIFHTILNNIQTIYLTELNQVILKLPDCVLLATDPSSEGGLHQLELMLLLLLGVAVQGPTRDYFVKQIQRLPNEQQVAIAGAIQQVTHYGNLILCFDGFEDQSPEYFHQYLKDVVHDRNNILNRWVEELRKRIAAQTSDQGTNQSAAEANHLSVEIVDLKSQIRRLRQTVDERSDHIVEITEELERVKHLNLKLQNENTKLSVEKVKADRSKDEWDALKEKVAAAESLEREVGILRRNLIDAKSNRNRLDELLADNKVLERSQEILEKQLLDARKKAKRIFEVEGELLSAQKVINDLELELDSARTKIQELEERNTELQQVARNAAREKELEEDGPHLVHNSKSEPDHSNTSIGEELNNNAQARALQLQLENRQLQIVIDNLKHKGFYDNANKILELEKEKKKLSLQCEKIQTECDRLKQTNSSFENLFKNAIEENNKLQGKLDDLKCLSDRQAQDLQHERSKQEELQKSLECSANEKEKILLLCDAIKIRADKAEKTNADLTETVGKLRAEVEDGRKVKRRNEELSERVETLERENGNLQKEVAKTKELLEIKSVDLDQRTDKMTILERQVDTLTKEKSEMLEQVEKLQDCERKAQELLSQAAVHSETITTLQKDLVAEKVSNEKFRSNVEKLGLSLDVLENDINVILEKMLDNLEVSKALTGIYRTREVGVIDVDKHLEEMASSLTEEWRQQVEKLEAEIAVLQGANEGLHKENASLQVDVSTLRSQLQSLQMQQTALQLANSQLVAEKEDLSRLNLVQQNQHKTLSHDQSVLSNIHAELTTEYEKLLAEKETLKKANRDLKTDLRTYKENVESLENKVKTVEQEREKAKEDSKHLSYLRVEHSKLKNDFRNLLATSERFKAECKSSREELQSLRTEFRELKAANAEMKNEIDTKNDQIANLQLENAVLQQKCEMLQENLNKLDLTRISLLDSFSELCKQSLVCMADSMDRQNLSQMEAKHHWEQYNNILRQKDKLEEKIFDFYKKLDNANPKKGGFASLVRRVRKAGSGIMNRSRSNRRSSEEETPSRTVQAEPQVAGPSCSGSAESNNSSNGNESDNSAEDYVLGGLERLQRTPRGSLHGHRPRDEIELRRSQRHSTRRNSVASEELLLRDSPSLGSIGSRRTVYISEDEPAPSPPPIQSTPLRGEALRDANPPPLLVYNRISTVIGGDTLCTLGNQTNLPEIPREHLDSKKQVNAKETAVWYEYGCV